MKTPGLRSVNAGSASDAGGIIVVIRLVRCDYSRTAFRIDEDARIANQCRTSVMPIDSDPLITQVIATHV
jgi:hypothetical protein